MKCAVFGDIARKLKQCWIISGWFSNWVCVRWPRSRWHGSFKIIDKKDNFSDEIVPIESKCKFGRNYRNSTCVGTTTTTTNEKKNDDEHANNIFNIYIEMSNWSIVTLKSSNFRLKEEKSKRFFRFHSQTFWAIIFFGQTTRHTTTHKKQTNTRNRPSIGIHTHTHKRHKVGV